MLKRNKAVSIVMAICLCLAMLAPVFVAPKSAEASCTYDVVKAPTVNSDAGYQDLGVVKVTLPDTSIFNYSEVTVSLPSDVDFSVDTDAESAAPAKTTSTTTSKVTIVAPNVTDSDGLTTGSFKSISMSNNDIDITMSDNVGPAGSDKYFYIYFYGIDLNNTTGDITVDFTRPSNSAFSDTSSPLVIAKSTSEGSTTTSIKKVNNITDAGGEIQPITIQENTAGSFDYTDGPLTLEILTDGYSWDDSSTASSNVTYGWSLAGKTGASSEIMGNDSEKLKIKLTALQSDTDSAAKITLNNLKIDVDDSKATVGDEVQVKVSGYGIDKATVVVAKYCDYTATLEAGTTETLIAGQKDQDIGDFYVEEGASGSLTENRSLTFTLPSGVEWVTDYENSQNDTDNLGDYSVVNSSDIDLTSPSKATGDNNEIAKWTVKKESNSTNGAKIKFKDMKVCVSPAFSGTLTITVAGSAGVEGTIDVGTVVPAATITPGDIVNVQLGKPSQKINDITITEGADGGLLEHDLTLKLDDGYKFTSEPKVKVTDGNLDIDTANVTTDENVLTIPVTGDSSTASKIVISDIYIDADRTAPEGPITLQFGKNDSDFQDATTSDSGATATNEVPEYWNKSAGKAVVANCITAAPTTGGGEFTIGSNIYQSNGTKKIMDVAPYIKSSRSYVPMRYLADILGADVTWDGTAQTVTLTKGSTVVVFTIGSNSYTVNGAAQTADVAPEIVSSRTFLPARFAAEAFGYSVGWDQSTQTIVVSQ